MADRAHGSFMCLISSVILSCLVSLIVPGVRGAAAESVVPDEKWGYVQVRPEAFMFWWFYGASVPQERTALPLVIWLQGGPGGSGTGFGNFEEIGPLDANLQPRNTSWTQKANLLFVDNPVGSGFSYVTSDSAYTTNVTGIANDLLTWFKSFLELLPVFTNIPLYIFCESYGGKMTAAFGITLYKAVLRDEIACDFRGVALGDSWISPVDSVLAWGPFLYSVSLLDQHSLDKVNDYAEMTAEAVKKGQFENATSLWDQTEMVIADLTDDVNVYNILQHHAPPFPVRTGSGLGRLFQRHVGYMYGESLADLMNGPIRKKLGIIPAGVTWGGQSGEVFQYMRRDFMKDVIEDVSELVNVGVKVVVYEGQLDMICSTTGAEVWIKKLDWVGLQEFLSASRTPLYTASGQKMKQTAAFVKSYKNLSFYYIMKAGHMVPADAGEMALEMMARVIKWTQTRQTVNV